MALPVIGAIQAVPLEERIRIAMVFLQSVGPVAESKTTVNAGVATTESTLVKDDVYELRQACARFLHDIVDPSQQEAVDLKAWQK
jgi:hypothetical protein